MFGRPDIEPWEYGGRDCFWQKTAERLERLRRHYGLACCLLCVFTVTGIALTGVVHGWPWTLFMLCYTVMLAAWVSASILLLLRAAVCGARVVLMRIQAMRTEPPSPRRFGTVGQHATAWETRDRLPAALEDNPPDRLQAN